MCDRLGNERLPRLGRRADPLGDVEGDGRLPSVDPNADCGRAVQVDKRGGGADGIRGHGESGDDPIGGQQLAVVQGDCVLRPGSGVGGDEDRLDRAHGRNHRAEPAPPSSDHGVRRRREVVPRGDDAALDTGEGGLHLFLVTKGVRSK